MAQELINLSEALGGWHQGLLAWVKALGVPLPPALSAGLPDDAGPPRHRQVLFGDNTGHPLWERWRDVPGASARDLLLQMVSTQTDCHMAAVEMAAPLLAAAPGPQDLASLQLFLESQTITAATLGAVLIRHFPKRGGIAAAQLLERSATAHTRVLGAFNHPLRHWVDLLCFGAFSGLCARFALECLAVSGFAPVAGACQRLSALHREQARTGAWGLSRVVEAGVIPVDLMQRCINRWVGLTLDLFGWDRSDSAALAYRSGLKGRVHELVRSTPPEDPALLNDDARIRWLYEVEGVLTTLNDALPSEHWLRLPPVTANRAGPPSATPDLDVQWPVPSSADDERLAALCARKDFILPA